MSREEHSKQRLPSTTEFSFKEHSPTNHSPRKYSPTQYSPRRYSPREYSPREYSHTAVIPPATSFTYPSYRNPKPNPNTLPMHISRSHPRQDSNHNVAYGVGEEGKEGSFRGKCTG
eukprot:1389815-Amorphochlora_amoeboformis.AAC.1